MKKSQKTQTINDALEIEAANAGLLAPTATDLLCLIESGEDDKATERIQTLGQRDFTQVTAVVQKLAAALASYAQSWGAVELP